jgi:hypothetical protein
MTDEYEMIDSYLRNNLHDDDYAEYSAALDEVAHGAEQAKAALAALKQYADLAVQREEEMKQKCWLVCDGIVRFFEDSKDLNPLHRREMETAIAIAKQIKDLK